MKLMNRLLSGKLQDQVSPKLELQTIASINWTAPLYRHTAPLQEDSDDMDDNNEQSPRVDKNKED